jgi:hypothetical protein
MGDDIKSALDAILNKLSTVKKYMTTMKSDQSRLTVAINRL